MIRVLLPHHLQVLAQVGREVELQIEGVATLNSILNALENSYPVLNGTIRDQVTLQRRPFLRFFACGQDFSLEDPDTILPDAVLNGVKPLLIVGAMAGG
ncbi:MAG: MoaD/ThiS family protein [Chloroflexota bacterium]